MNAVYLKRFIEGLSSDKAISKTIGKIGNFIPAISTFLLAIWTLPNVIFLPAPGLDPSWKIGLYTAVLKNLQFGKDIAFTYGPLGFLWQPDLIDYNLWRVALLYNLMVHAIFFIGVYALLKAISAKKVLYIFVLPIIVLAMPFPDYKLLFGVAFLLYYYVNKEQYTTLDFLPFALMGCLLAITSMIKFNILIMAAYIIAVAFLIFAVKKKKLKYPVCMLAFYGLSLLAIWLILGQNLLNFYDYIYTGVELSRGYNDAMVIQPTNLQAALEIATLLFITAWIIYSFLKKNSYVFYYLIISLVFFATGYKYGLIRNNMLYYWVSIPLLVFFLIMLVNGLSVRKPFTIKNLITIEHASIVIITVIVLASLALLYQEASWIINDNITTRVTQYEQSWKLFNDPALANDKISAEKIKIKNEYALDNWTINYIDGKTLDIFPWDIALCWSNDFNWSPRPVFQSYSAYTQKLDEINSRHFSGPESPQLILYRYESIDYRYPQLDEPETFKEIIKNYRYVNSTVDYILLERKTSSISTADEPLGNRTGKMGEVISIPEYGNGYLFGNIMVKSSFYGTVLSVLYKPEHLTFHFVYDNGTVSKTYWLIPGTARDGLFLSAQIDSAKDLIPILNGQLNRDIAGVVVDALDPMQYDSTVTIDFVGVKCDHE